MIDFRRLPAWAVRFSLAVASATAVAPAWSQAEPPPVKKPAGAKAPTFAPDAELLAAFGGKDGIFRLADRFVDRMRADARIGHYFEKTDLPELKKLLGDQLCQVLAGPCVYEGATMKASHADLGITRADSLAQVEVLQDSMDAEGIPFRAQNRLLARLAPMYRDIIEK